MIGLQSRTQTASKPLRIALVMQGGRSWIGGAAYIECLASALSRLESGTRSRLDLRLYYKEAHPSDSLSRECLNSFDGVHAWPLWKRAARKAVEKLSRGRSRAFDLLAERGIDFAYPHFSKGAASCRSAAWIPDFQHRHLPEFFSKREIAFRGALYGRIAERAETVVLSSAAAGADFRRFYPNAAGKARILSPYVAPQRAWLESDAQAVQRKYGLPDRFFVISNQFWAHKNHAVVFDALAELAARGVRPAVACTGLLEDARRPGYAREILGRLRARGLEAQVRLLGLVPRANQVQLLRRALAVIQPSLFEGWSGTVEDARTLGKNILLSDIPVHREQDPPRARYFNPRDAGALAHLIERAWLELAPGPVAADETEAAALALERSLDFARAFLTIAEGNR